MRAYPFVEVALPEAQAEAAAAFLLELGSTGIELRDQGTMISAPEGRTVLVAWFARERDAEDAARELPALLRAPDLEAVAGQLEDPGWREAWRQYFRPMRFGRRLWVAPPGENPPADGVGSADPAVVRLVPSGAFGAGTHESTALMLELLDELVAPGMTVLDVGCGSAILALASLRLGAAKARGVDIDPEALEYARENARDNDLADRCQLDGAPLARLDERYDLVLANLSAPVLLAEKAALARLVGRGGRLIWSGLLRADLPELGAPPGLRLADERSRNDWVAQVWAHDGDPSP